MKVKFIDLGKQYENLRDEIIQKFDKISLSGNYVLSKELEVFEKNFASLCQTKYAIGVGNGSDALFLGLKALGIGPGDEVITVPNSFVATAWVIANTGATIRFCDVDENMNINPDLIESVISKKTKAILPVHLTGRVADMDRINFIAEKYNLFLIEDAAQAIGASYKSRKAGSFGDFGAFSLHPLKNLHVHGDGGMITTSNLELYQKIIKYRNHGLVSRDECEFWGVNSRLDEIHAGIGNIKLKYLQDWTHQYRKFAQMYIEHLKDYVIVPKIKNYEKPVFHRFMIQSLDRDNLLSFLAEHDIETKVNYPIPLHLQPAAKNLNYKLGDFPVAEDLSNKILSLPLYPEIAEDQIMYVIERIIQFCQK